MEASQMSMRGLEAIFVLPDSPAPSSQCSAHTEDYMSSFERFTLNPEWKMLYPPIEAISERISLFRKTMRIWNQFHEYGCMAIMNQSSQNENTTHLWLIALDNWKLHLQPRQGGTHFVSQPHSFSELLYVGFFPTSHYEDFLHNFADIWPRAIENTGAMRRAEPGHRGHQKTATWVQAVLKDCLGVSTSNSESRGAMTDVGLHTGGFPRDTSWPLAQSIIETACTSTFGILDAPTPPETSLLNVHFALLYYKTWLMEHYVTSLKVDSLDSKAIDRAYTMMEQLALEGSALADLDMDTDLLRQKLESKRLLLVNLSLERNKSELDRWKMPQFPTQPLSFNAEDASGISQMRLQQIFPPPKFSQLAYNASPEEIRKSCLANLDPCSLPLRPDISSLSSSEMLNWLHNNTNTTLPMVLVATSTVEAWFFNRSRYLSSPSSTNEITHADLKALIDLYIKRKKTINAEDALLEVEERSLELLVIWIAYCIADRIATEAHPLVKSYGVSLDPLDLKYLTLSSKKAEEAMENVHAYLVARTSRQPLFNLAEQASTFIFAEAYGRADASIVGIWSQECKDAEKRKDDLWKRILGLREVLQYRRDERDQAKSNLEAKTREYNDCKHRSHRSWNCPLRASVGSLQGIYDAAVRSVAEAGKSPRDLFVVQPLPSGESLAFQHLFFHNIPPTIKLLLRLSLQAQHLLLGKLASTISPGVLDMSAHYKSRSTRQQAKRPHALLYISDKPLEYPAFDQIEEFSSGAQGVWFPNGTPCLHARTERNPFLMIADRDAQLTCYWTSTFAKCNSRLNWVLRAHSKPNTNRSNLAIADPSSRPSFLQSKAEWQVFTSMRSFPLLQVRKLICTIHDRSLPFDDPQVQLLIRQLVFQIGELSTSTPLNYCWRKDLTHLNGRVELVKELLGLADELSDLVRYHKSMALLCEISAYLCQYESSKVQGEVLRSRCVEIVMRWAEMVGQEVRANPHISPAELYSKRGLQCLFYMYGILAYGGNAVLDRHNLEKLCTLNVLARQGHVFLSGSSYRSSSLQLVYQTRTVLSRRIHDIIDDLQDQQSQSRLLNALLRQIHSSAASSEPHLRWAPFLDQSSLPIACFAATSPSDNHYCFNLWNGVFLVNGRPSSTLPSTVLNHPLFLRTFGNRDFEVVSDHSGGAQVLRTRDPVNDCFFEFDTPTDQTLIIREIPAFEMIKDCVRDTTGKNLALELLDSAAPWSINLPPRLRTLYSHWLNRESGVIVLRGISFAATATSFIWVPWKDPRTDSPNVDVIELVRQSSGAIFEVPLQHQAVAWIRLVEWARTNGAINYMLLSQDEKHSSPVHQILAKFETSDLVHTWIDTTRAHIKFDFPRFRMSFELKQRRLYSLDFGEYFLSPIQQLDGALKGFTRYLLLQRDSETTASKVLIPVGAASKSQNQTVISHPRDSDQPDFVHRYYTYDVHVRFKELRSSSIAGRLHLAGLYAACSSMMSEEMNRMTGDETSLHLLRRCFVDRPLSEDEQLHLSALLELSWHVPAVHILARGLLEISRSVDFLHEFSPQPSSESSKNLNPVTSLNISDIHTLSDHVGRYVQYKKRPFVNARRLLTPREEYQHIGFCPPFAAPTRSIFGGDDSLLEPLGIKSAIAQANSTYKQVETKIFNSLTPSSQDSPALPCPIEASESSTLVKEMFEELKDSWKAHQERKKTCFSVPILQQISLMLDDCREQCAQSMELVEEKLMNAIEALPAANVPSVWRKRSFVLFLAAGSLGQLKMEDFITFIWSPELIKHYNPFIALHITDVETIKDAAIVWMKLAVLDDKLRRLSSIASAATNPSANINDLESDFVKEASVVRHWNPHQHPRWLAFEVCAQLQIRPNQYIIAREMLDNPGSICQLNMGEGKTRVILPMLLLELTDISRRHFSKRSIPRLHVLPQLMSETFQHMHEYLCGGILNQKMMQMPFIRDVELTSDRMVAIRKHISFCQQEGGTIILTPATRCSMILKVVELRQRKQDTLADELDALERLPWVDLFDESDSMFSHKYQLIYSQGSQQELPGLEQRFNAAHLLITAIRSQHEFFQKRPTIYKYKPSQDPSHFGELRLLPGEALEEATRDLHELLAAHLWDSSPALYALRWVQATVSRDLFITYLTNFNETADNILSVDQLKGNRTLMLALRGHLAFGILKHCLTLQNCINYGLDANRKKRLAVPYLACDAPSPASDFAHPDVAITLTTLSYFHTGLNDKQVGEAFSELLCSGETAMKIHYRVWYDLSFHNDPDSDEAKTIDVVGKLDLTNRSQVQLLCRRFRHNYQTIIFWLKRCCLPEDTAQFAGRIQSSAWHLAEHGERSAGIGFSGTNDFYRLLPMQVRQHPIPLDSPIESKNPLGAEKLDRLAIVGTNGKMLELIIDHATVADEAVSDSIDLIDRCLNLSTSPDGCAALIDAGGLLAGTPNSQAALEFITRLNGVEGHEHIKGVVYFGEQEWMVLDRSHGVNSLRSGTALKESQCFVIFDQQRCRGADMKLQSNARAVLTLGSRMLKDNLMQGAGRLRRLGRSQSLLFMAQNDVVREICRINNITSDYIGNVTSRMVVQWAMENSIRECERGLSEHLAHGLAFLRTQQSSDSFIVPEAIDLDTMYSGKESSTMVGAFITAQSEEDIKGWANHASLDRLKGYHNKLSEVAMRYGDTMEVKLSGLNEECQREVEKETQQEEEKELQVAPETPFDETDWNYDTVFQALCTRDSIIKASSAISLSSFSTKQHLCLADPDDVSLIQWNKLRVLEDVQGISELPSVPSVYLTKNYWQSIGARDAAPTHVNLYLRTTDVVLQLSDLSLLLVSDREANGILSCYWKRTAEATLQTAKIPVRLFHLSFICRSFLDSSLPLSIYAHKLCESGTSITDRFVIQESLISHVMLFAGLTNFEFEQRCNALEAILPDDKAKHSALFWVKNRDLRKRIAHSDLERICGVEEPTTGVSTREKELIGISFQDSPDASHH